MGTRAKKRPNGEGTIWYDSSRSRYRGQYHDNNLARRSVTGRTYAETAKKLREALQLRDQNLSPRKLKDVESLDTFMDHWFQLSAQNWQFKTIERNRSDLEKHIKPILGNKKISLINSTDIESMYLLLKVEKHLSDYSILRIHNIMNSIFKKAQKTKRINFNPMEAVQRPVIKERNVRALTNDQVAKLVSHASKSGQMWLTMWLLALCTGLRQGELLGLRWDDLDWDSGHLRVERQIQRQTGNGLVTKGLKQTGTYRRKSKERTLTLASNTTLLQQLRAWKKLQNEQRLANERYVSQNLIFANNVGGPLEPRRVYQVWKSHLNEAGIPHIKLHGARSTFATLAIQNGADIKTVSHFLGHADYRTTIQIYLKVTDESMNKTAEIMESVIARNSR